MEKVDVEGDHWIWSGAKFPSGYGVFWYGGRTGRAHRAAWEIFMGPTDGQVVRHFCGRRDCVNPGHMGIGQPADNSIDSVALGQTPRGASHGRAILKERDVIEIRASTETAKALAARFGVSEATVVAARTGRNWKHVPMSEATG